MRRRRRRSVIFDGATTGLGVLVVLATGAGIVHLVLGEDEGRPVPVTVTASGAFDLTPATTPTSRVTEARRPGAATSSTGLGPIEAPLRPALEAVGTAFADLTRVAGADVAPGASSGDGPRGGASDSSVVPTGEAGGAGPPSTPEGGPVEAPLPELQSTPARPAAPVRLPPVPVPARAISIPPLPAPPVIRPPLPPLPSAPPLTLPALPSAPTPSVPPLPSAPPPTLPAPPSAPSPPVTAPPVEVTAPPSTSPPPTASPLPVPPPPSVTAPLPTP